MKLARVVYEVLRSSLVDLLRSPLSSALALLAMGVAVFLLAAFLVVGGGLSRIFDRWADQAALEVYFHDSVDAAQAQSIADEVRREPVVRRATVIDGDRAMEEFRELFPDLGDVPALLGGNPLPRSLRVVPEDQDVGRLQDFITRWSSRPEVHSVRFDQEWLESLSQLGRSLRAAIALGSAILLLAALATVGSVVRLALDDKRTEVELMRLVGAPTSFVLAPILVSGALLAGGGAAAAVWLLEFLREWAIGRAVSSPLEGIATVLLGSGLPPESATALVIGAAAAGLVAAGLAGGRAAVR